MRFLSAMIDTLLPGGELANDVMAPAASSLAIGWDAIRAQHGPALAAIAAGAGGEDAFCSSTEDFRTDVLKRIETSHPEHFAGLVAVVLALYYEHPDVITAFGWPARPPQPLGHEIEPFDESLLQPVKARGAIWRKPG